MKKLITIVFIFFLLYVFVAAVNAHAGAKTDDIYDFWYRFGYQQDLENVMRSGDGGWRQGIYDPAIAQPVESAQLSDIDFSLPSNFISTYTYDHANDQLIVSNKMEYNIVGDTKQVSELTHTRAYANGEPHDFSIQENALVSTKSFTWELWVKGTQDAGLINITDQIQGIPQSITYEAGTRGGLLLEFYKDFYPYIDGDIETIKYAEYNEAGAFGINGQYDRSKQTAIAKPSRGVITDMELYSYIYNAVGPDGLDLGYVDPNDRDTQQKQLYELYQAGVAMGEASMVIDGVTWYYFSDQLDGHVIGDYWQADGYNYIYLGSGISTENFSEGGSQVPEPATIFIFGSILSGFGVLSKKFMK